MRKSATESRITTVANHAFNRAAKLNPSRLIELQHVTKTAHRLDEFAIEFTVDLAAQQSALSAVAEATPLITFQNLVSSGNGLVIGRNIAKFWGNQTDANDIRETLQTVHPIGSAEFTRLEAIYRNWNAWTIDVPGKYYLEVVEKLYKRNELARGSFVALGQKIDLSRLRLPIYLLAGSADDVVAPEQLLAVQRLVGTGPEALCHQVAPCNHLSLFMGRRTLEEVWPGIVRWMKEAV